MKSKMLVYIFLLSLLLWSPAVGQSLADDHLVASKEQILFYTSALKGKRMADGRPKVSDELIERLKDLRAEDAWQYQYEKGYKNQFETRWKKIHSDHPIVRQVLTAQYMPKCPDIMDQLVKEGTGVGHAGPMNTWPIDMLRDGDVYLADSFGKIAQGTLIGSNLGNSILNNSGKGVIVNGSLRDEEDLDGFNAFVRNWHPSFLEVVMLTGVNVPIRIGGAGRG